MNRYMRILAALLLLALTATTSALAESETAAQVAVNKLKVYATAAPHQYLGALPKGTVVTVTARSGQAALIACGGRTGIVDASGLTAVETAQTAPATGTAMVTVRATRAYKKAKKSSRSVAVKAGLSVNRIGASGKFSKVERNGVIAYIPTADLGLPGAQAQTEVVEETAEAVVTEPSVVTVNKLAVTTRDTRVYSRASTSASYVNVAKGTRLTLVAYKGNCAQVESSGVVGYAYYSHLTVDADAVQQAETDSGSEVQTSELQPTVNYESGSNKEIIYRFLTQQMGYNRAAACGVLANVRYESDYSPTCYGDSGTSYGICQWHAGRKSSLISWCENHGYDYKTLKGQLYYLEYDLKNNYPKVHSYLKGVPNTADGAYDAGYYFCFNFEAPASRTSQSTKRGNYAQNTLFSSTL